ncbi:hypothetical protein [Bdellovibrio bacteriovorus]|uniref:hypothetical protein n=1 Tax=Bdellovibrio bacteriovorus TaxID=959 RepID=UPI003D05FC4A
MKTLFSFVLIMLLSSASQAHFGYQFRCHGENQNQIIHLKVGPHGLETVRFRRELVFLNQYQLLSQYADYGSMQFIWQSKVSEQRAHLTLDMVTARHWTGTLTLDGTENISITCQE